MLRTGTVAKKSSDFCEACLVSHHVHGSNRTSDSSSRPGVIPSDQGLDYSQNVRDEGSIYIASPPEVSRCCGLGSLGVSTRSIWEQSSKRPLQQAGDESEDREHFDQDYLLASQVVIFFIFFLFF